LLILTRKTFMNTLRIWAAASLAAVLSLASLAQASDGLVGLRSPHNVKETMDRLEAVAKSGGFTVFARVDHAAGAAKIGKTLRPTEVLIFGNPAGGTPFMECAQSVGIDLPLKALVWEDASKQVWLGYNDPAFIAQRHETPSCAAVLPTRQALAGLAEAAVAP
jgi:uncharacterized protein (DUF302 family)